MSARCIGEPVSWLRLERLHVGDVDDAERTRIAGHLAACPACKACLEKIERDDTTALPALPEPRVAARRRPAPRWAAGALGAVVLAAAAALAVGKRVHENGPLAGAGTVTSEARVKGGAVAFSLVRDDSEWIAESTGVFRDGDRFKAVVTCPPALEATFDLVVFDASGASFPLSPARVACGNDVPIAGAFQLSGSSEETVCLVWGDDGAPDRGSLAGGVQAFGERALCKKLTAGAR